MVLLLYFSGHTCSAYVNGLYRQQSCAQLQNISLNEQTKTDIHEHITFQDHH